MINMTTRASLVFAFLFLVLPGCSAVQKERFSHRFHRLQYGLTDDEVKGLQFYLSSDVLAQTASPKQRTPTGTSVVLVPRDIPGVATAVGRDWIRVTFRKGGHGVPFLSDIASTTDAYLLYSLATTVEGSDQLRKVADVPNNVAYYEGNAYTIAQGYNAVLMVDSEQLQELINTRKLGPGVEIK